MVIIAAIRVVVERKNLHRVVSDHPFILFAKLI